MFRLFQSRIALRMIARMVAADLRILDTKTFGVVKKAA